MAAHMRGESTPPRRNTDDPFSPDYVDPAMTRRERRRAARKASGEGGGGRWTALYLLAAAIVAGLVWLLFGMGV